MRAFLQAIEQDPGNPEFIQNLLQLLAQQRKWKDALPHVRRLIELEPENTQSKELLTQIEKMAQQP